MQDMVGRKFNKWTVIRLSEFRAKSSKDKFWDCRCDCGVERPVKACYLRTGQSKQCRACAHESYRIRGRKIPNHYWDSLQHNARKRSIAFNITKDDICNLLERQNGCCCLSGIPVVFAKTESEHNQGKTTASVDRRDSGGDYSVDNVQIVHKTINFMKHTLNQLEFLHFCEAVTAYHTKKECQ